MIYRQFETECYKRLIEPGEALEVKEVQQAVLSLDNELILSSLAFAPTYQPNN